LRQHTGKDAGMPQRGEHGLQGAQAQPAEQLNSRRLDCGTESNFRSPKPDRQRNGDRGIPLSPFSCLIIQVIRE
jgi:hypothetical protein